MTLTSFALMFLFMLVRSDLSYLFGRLGKAIPPPPYSVCVFKPLQLSCDAARQNFFQLPCFWVVDYKTTLRNARKKCKKNKIVTCFNEKLCRLPEFHGHHTILHGPYPPKRKFDRMIIPFQAGSRQRPMKCSGSSFFPSQ